MGVLSSSCPTRRMSGDSGDSGGAGGADDAGGVDGAGREEYAERVCSM